MKKPLIIIAYTQNGIAAGKEISQINHLNKCTIFAPERLVSNDEEVKMLPSDAKKWIQECWGNYDFLFICATGIAIRMIAPCVQDKFQDSAVLVMDEKMKFIIPLLSGHLGGAVSIARLIEEQSSATAVITTATDINEKFAVDVFAKKNHLLISSREKAKEISAMLLENKTIGVFISKEIKGSYDLPSEVVVCRDVHELEKYDGGMVIAASEKECNSNYLCLYAKNVVVGVGCRRETPVEQIREGIQLCLERYGFKSEQIQAVVSIDIKKEEQGICKFCEENKVPFLVFSKEELQEVGSVSSSSEFVKQVTGVDNVCERSVKKYLSDQGSGQLIQSKKVINGITIAIGCV